MRLSPALAALSLLVVGPFACATRAPSTTALIEPSRPSAERAAQPAEAPALRLTVSQGKQHACATVDGSVWCWGVSEHGELGVDPRQTCGTAFHCANPVRVPGISDAVQVIAGVERTCAVTRDGRVSCWGELNRAAPRTFVPPARLAAPRDVAELSLGVAHACVRHTSGTVACWGEGNFGQLGAGSDTARVEPAVVGALSDVTQLASGTRHTCALERDGTVSCWGENVDGQLGAESKDSCVEFRTEVPCSLRPIRVAGLAGAVEIAAGGRRTCARLRDGSVRCWGNGEHGSLGSAASEACPVTGSDPMEKQTTPCSRAPVAVDGVAGATQIAVGDSYACAVLRDGRLACWGSNEFGQLGLETGEPCRVGPVDFRCATKPAIVAVTDVAHVSASGIWGAHPTCAVTKTDVLWCWGNPGSFAERPRDRAPRRIAFLERAAVLGPPAEPEVEVPSSRPSGPSTCLKDTGGCASQPTTAIPRCPARTPATDLATAFTNATASVGKPISVRGPLTVEGGIRCTAKGCGGPGSCCNMCSGRLAIGQSAARSPYFELRSDALHACLGDESLVCCRLDAHGQDVVVTGVVRREWRGSEVFVLDHPSVCAP